MEEEAEKLKEMQKEVDTQMNMTSPTTASEYNQGIYNIQLYTQLEKKINFN
jgi:hypothetical protein